MKKPIIIIAPHADDEIIGCHSYLYNHRGIVIVYFGTDKAREEATESAKFYDFEIEYSPEYVPWSGVTYLFPDPYFETHPEHRRLGALGETWARQMYDVIFYSTNMNAPYIAESEHKLNKKEELDMLYPEKADLWKYDHKYWLFEGHCKWIF